VAWILSLFHPKDVNANAIRPRQVSASVAFAGESFEPVRIQKYITYFLGSSDIFVGGVEEEI
jgi:hypothetical protein